MFVRITARTGEQLDVSPELANELMARVLIYQCRSCGLCHLMDGHEWSELQDAVQSMVH